MEMTTSLTDLPNDVLAIILENISKSIIRKNISTPSIAIKTLLRLEATSKGLNKIINNECCNVWKSAWETFIEEKDDLKSVDSRNPKECLLLYSLTGCQFCLIPRIRKVYTEFRARCCKECLYKRTLSDYMLTNKYLVSLSKINNLPSITKELWSRKIGTYTLVFYWIDDVEKRLGFSLDEYKILEKERRDAIERKKNEARIIQENIQNEKLIKDIYELASNDPKYACLGLDGLDVSDVEYYINSYKKSNRFNKCNRCNNNATDILNTSLKIFHVKQFDKIIIKGARSRKISVVDVRKTDLYKHRVLDDVFFNFTESEWNAIIYTIAFTPK